jgi:hypothetical protein
VISTRVVNSPLKIRRERGLVYLLTGWICCFVFLPFILFDFRKTSQGKNFQKIQSVLRASLKHALNTIVKLCYPLLSSVKLCYALY